MDASFIRSRITELRLQKNISEHRLSLDLGHGRSYIHNIVSGQVLPSLSELLYICEYFEMTPSQFFSEDGRDSCMLADIYQTCRCLSPADQEIILSIAKRLRT